jgi:hypothetical protein
MRGLAVVLVVAASASMGCAVHAPAHPATHPASATAPTGRLAGAPPALRAGVVEYPDVPAIREGAPADEHHHHHQP